MKKFSFAAVLLLSAAVISTGCGRKTGSVGDAQPVMEEVQEDTASYITEEETEPELDDEFAKDVSEFDTFDEYKADVRATLQKRMDDGAETAFKDEVIRKACETMTGEIPEVMFEEKVDEFLRNYAAQFGMNDRDMSREELLKLFGMNEDTLKFSKPTIRRPRKASEPPWMMSSVTSARRS